MIASRKHNFIFIKTMKTASTSIEMALSRHCGPYDIVSSIGAKHDIKRFVEHGVAARRFSTPEIEKRYRKLLRKGNKQLLRDFLNRTRPECFPGHAKPAEIKEKVGAFWDSGYKFSVERHPYEKVLSLAAMTRSSIMKTVYIDNRYVGHPWYADDNGRLVVDHVILHHRLAEDFAAVLIRLGLPSTPLPHARRTDRDRTPAREQLTADQRAFIYERCALEFELFGWER